MLAFDYAINKGDHCHQLLCSLVELLAVSALGYERGFSMNRVQKPTFEAVINVTMIVISPTIVTPRSDHLLPLTSSKERNSLNIDHLTPTTILGFHVDLLYFTLCRRRNSSSI